MIDHCQSTIGMAEEELSHGNDAEVKKIAKGVIDEKLDKILKLPEWLGKSNGY